jgi:hypothetical protein
MVAVRCVVLGLAAMLYATEPLPVPLAPLVMDTHVALSTAVQAHPAGIEIAIVPVDDAAPTDTLVGEIVDVHGMPACVTVNDCPAIVTTPTRCEMVVFAAML